MKITTLETERLVLQPISSDDRELIFELYNSPKFIEFIGDRKIRTLQDAENYIKEKFLPQLEKLGFGNYLIVRKEDQKKVGAVGIFEREGLPVHDIGFSFLPQFEGKGYGYESASKLMETGFREFGLKKISAITSPTNVRSQKLIEKLGLKFKKYIQFPGGDEELLYYEKEKD